MSRIPITDEHRNALNALHQSTGVGPQRLLRGKADKPQGLNSTTIYHWMDGTLQTAKSVDLEFVLCEWQMQSALEPFTDSDLAKLEKGLARTGYKPTALLRRISPLPDGLTPDVLHRLRSRRLKKIATTHKVFLFNQLAELPDKDVKPPKPYLGRNTKSD